MNFKLKFLGLKQKIFSGYGIIILMTVFITVISLINIAELSKSSSMILQENYRSIIAAEHMIDSIERQDSLLLITIIDNDKKHLVDVQSQEEIFYEWLTRASDNVTIEGEQEIISELKQDYKVYREKIISFFREPDFNFYKEELMPVFNNIRKNCKNLSQLNHDYMYIVSEQTSVIGKKALIKIGVVGIILVISGIFISAMLSAIIVRPVKELVSGVEKISSGDMDFVLPVNTSDELGLLTSHFNQMIRKLDSYNKMNIQAIYSEKMKNETIIRTIDDGIIFVDKDFSVVNINLKAMEIYKIKNNDWNGRHFLEVVKDMDIFNDLKKLMSGLKEEISKNKIINRQNEYYEVIFSEITNNSSDVNGTVILLRDISEQKKLQELKNDFIMTASHELRTPLTSLLMSIDLINDKKQSKSDEDKELIGVIREEAYRLNNIVSDMLNISKIDSGQITMDFKDVDLDYILKDIFELYSKKADGEKKIFKIDINEDSKKVYADSEKIIWVFSNLLSNAFKFTDQGDEISIKSEKYNNSVKITVSDTGRGIPKKNLSSIFEKFDRGNVTDIEGTGLGLSISREVVKAHNGNIWVESEEGKGSRFNFTIPLNRKV